MELPDDIKTNVVDDDFATLLDDTNVHTAEAPPPISEDHQPEGFEEQGQQQGQQQEGQQGQFQQPNAKDEKIAATLAELMVRMFDVTHNSLMKWVSDEPDGSKFAVSERQKMELKDSVTKVISAYNFTAITPVQMLVVVAIIIYLPSTLKAFEIKSMKDRFKKDQAAKAAAAEAKARGEAPPPQAPPTATGAATPGRPGRPAGTTKEAMELRKKLLKK